MAVRVWAVAVAALAAGCAVRGEPPTRDGAACVALFEQYDRIERYGPQPTFDFGFGGDSDILPPRLERQTQDLRRAGCFTRPEDIDGMRALSEQLANYSIDHGGAEIRPVPVHVGVVQAIGDEARTTEFFRGLGYRSRGIGAPAMGRRIYIGPFDSEDALAQAIDVAREAGFIAPYAATQTRF